MEELDLVQSWLENEKELRPLLEKLRPLLEERARLEEKDPRLLLLRSSKKELLPSEFEHILAPAPPPSSSSATVLRDTGAPIVGLPSRPVPDMEKFQKMVQKKRVQNRKKHEKEKKKRAEAKGKKVPEDTAMGDS